MTFSAKYSSFFLLFLQYGEAIGVNLIVGVFGMFFPSTFLKQLCPRFSESNVIEHAVLHMMTRMFCTVMILLGMIEYSLVRYCTTSSSTGSENRSTKEYVLKIFVSCMAIGDLIHTFSFLNYHLAYGSSLDLSSIGNLYGSIVLFVARITFLWFNYQNMKNKRKVK